MHLIIRVTLTTSVEGVLQVLPGEVKWQLKNKFRFKLINKA